MGGRKCCVKNCGRSSHDHRGRKIANGLTFHCFPAWRWNEGGQISELTWRRRKAWVSAVGRNNITFNHIRKSMRVCSRHFISGKPAYEMLESDPDWLPSLHMGHDEDDDSRRAERLPLVLQETQERRKHADAEKTALRESAAGETAAMVAAAGGTAAMAAAAGETAAMAAAAGGTAAAAGGTADCRGALTLEASARKPVVPPWTDVKSLLQTVLPKKTNMSAEPGDETPLPAAAAAEENDVSFRDFFRAALEASLDASSRTRTRTGPGTGTGTGTSSPPYEVELSIRLPPVKEEKSCEESSSCLNCVRLQRRVQQLEEKLSGLSEPPEDTKSPAVLSEPPAQQNQVLHSPERACLQSISPPPPPQEDHQDADWTPVGAGGQSKPNRSARCVPRFQKSWLMTFWFLRYSASQNLMWCHVCRLHADKVFHNLSLIKGSRMFKVHNIKKHSVSNYHKDSVERYMLHMSQLQP